MKAITVRSQIRNVARAWKLQYPDSRYGKDKPLIGSALAALDPETATAEDVAKAIGNGNTSWAKPQHCDECGLTSPVVVRLGQEPDYESSTALVCLKCLREALTLAESEAGATPPTAAEGQP